MPTSMRAAVLRESPGQLSIETVDIDDPGPREVLIRTAATGLCHSDLHWLDGHYGAVGSMPPRVLGHEAAGIVEAVGREVTDVAVGDAVVTCPSVFCGHCDYCLSGRPSLCDRQGTDRDPAAPSILSIGGEPVIRSAGLASFAEKMVVNEHGVVKIRPDVPLDVVAPIGCAVLTGIGAVWHAAQIEPGSTVAVVGCGGVGLNCIQGAALAGASRIIAIDANPAKLVLAEQFGATHLIDATKGDPVQAVHSLTPGVSSPGVDYSFEAIGKRVTAEQAFAMLHKGGTATILGVMPGGTVLEFPAMDIFFERKIQGSLMGSNRFRQDVPRFIELYLEGRLKLDELVSARITLDEINEGFTAMKNGDVARSVIVFG